MATELYTIKRRLGWETYGEVAVEITCEPTTSGFVKLGLAVRAAFLQGADLQGAYLRGAYLQDAFLRGAYLQDAFLRGAFLQDAFLQGADLQGADLRGADLQGAFLQGADLQGAFLQGADLQGAFLQGALVNGEKVTRRIASAERDDGYTFVAFELEAGGVKIAAGCRWFTPAEYLAHVAKEYPGTDKAAETLAILAFVEQRMTDLGIGEKPKRGRKPKAVAA